MQQAWNFTERRKQPRYDLVLHSRHLDAIGAVTTHGQTVNISSQGVGLVLPRTIAANADIQIWLTMPDTGEEIYCRGKVVWFSAVGLEHYRAGVLLEQCDLKPIPLVMRTIKSQIHTRYY